MKKIFTILALFLLVNGLHAQKLPVQKHDKKHDIEQQNINAHSDNPILKVILSNPLPDLGVLELERSFKHEISDYKDREDMERKHNEH